MLFVELFAQVFKHAREEHISSSQNCYQLESKLSKKIKDICESEIINKVRIKLVKMKS